MLSEPPPTMSSSTMDADDQGHRHGNFPNYYSFHPPQNRLQVLSQTGILNYIFRGLLEEDNNNNNNNKNNNNNNENNNNNNNGGQLLLSSSSSSGQPVAVVAQPTSSTATIDTSSSSSSSSSHKGNEATTTTNDVESTVSSSSNNDANKKRRIEDDSTTNNASSSKKKKKTFYYCDLGCNEGDLTMAMAMALSQLNYNCSSDANKEEEKEEQQQQQNVVVQETSTPSSMHHHVKCLGLDLDPMLIERAASKFYSSKSSISNSVHDNNGSGSGSTATFFDPTTISASFQVGNLCSQSDHNGAYTSFLTNNHRSTATTEKSEGESGTQSRDNNNNSTHESTISRQIFHLTTIFSTTMWIHLHAGDNGLKQFLERACAWTKQFLLVEPQPSACYRKANTRLRKMGRPELDDVTSNRLKLRPDIEEEIGNVIIRCGFRRVSHDEIKNAKSSCPGDKKVQIIEQMDAVTSWNRSLQLYERVKE